MYLLLIVVDNERMHGRLQNTEFEVRISQGLHIFMRFKKIYMYSYISIYMCVFV